MESLFLTVEQAEELAKILAELAEKQRNYRINIFDGFEVVFDGECSYEIRSNANIDVKPIPKDVHISKRSKED